MKAITFILITIVIQNFGLPLDEENRSKRETELPKIKVKVFKQFDPNGLEVKWDVVENKDSAEPVIGYKLKVWELYKTVHTLETVNGEKFFVQKFLPDKLQFSTILEDSDARIYAMPANQTSYFFNNIRTNVQYVYTLQTYSKYRDGPRSAPVGIMSLPANTTTETPE